jgi:methylenetetrahydrofolate dehydrogenase (NADP+) / methenyltetrahydrofolate cyclohydrolase
MSVKEAVLLEGKVLAAKIQEEIKAVVQDGAANKRALPKLVAIQVQPDPNKADEVKNAASADWYIGSQEKLAQKLGILFQKISVPNNQKALEEKIQQFSQEKACHGIFLAMPFPSGIDSDKALLGLNTLKDVEGVTPASLGLIVLRKSKLIPSTAYAAFKLIEQAGLELRGKKAVIVGQSAIVGRPLQMLLGERRVTTIVCNTGTSTADLEKYISEADIVIGCAGQPGMIKGRWIKQDAVVIDIGTTEVNEKLTGDVEFEEAKKRASHITPVPGGVGPLTVTMLMQNLIHAYKWQQTS